MTTQTQIWFDVMGVSVIGGVQMTGEGINGSNSGEESKTLNWD